MTGPTRTSDSPPSRRETLRQLAWRLETPVGLAVMFGLAFLLRILVAPHLGFHGDLRLFQGWAARLAEVGPGDFYVEGQFADYPPGYLYVLWLTGEISAAPGYLLLKLPALVADLGIAWIAGTYAARLASESLKERWPVRALVAAAVLFNPAVLALGAVWGQVDSVPAMVVLLALLLLFTGSQTFRYELAAFLLLSLAVVMKPQTGFVFPVMFYALCRRYLYRRPASQRLDGALAIALIGVLSLGLWAMSGLAFGLGPVELVRFYQDSANVYPVTSANAFNLWGGIAFWRNDTAGDDALTVAGIPALRVGMLLLVAVVAGVLWWVHRALNRGALEARVLTVAAAITSLAAYVLLTRMHERYMFISIACLAPLIIARPLRLAYAALSALFVLNLWYPYAFFNAQWNVEDLRVQPLFDWLFGGFATDTWQKRLWSFAVVAVAVAATHTGFRWAVRSRARPVDRPPPQPEAPTRRRPEPPPAAPPVEPEPKPASRGAALGPLTLVAIACLFSLVVLRGETRPASNLNDSSFHLQMVRWAEGQIDAGRVPFDGWYPYLSLGSSFFHHYQSLPETLTAYTARLTGADGDSTYLWFLYLLLALWPIAVYAGARLLDWGRWAAASAAAVSPLVVSASGYGYEHGSYTWQGYGVYSQLWAMWLLPIAWGLTWRAVVHGRWYAAAAAALALTIACHFITGYLAVLTVAVWVVVLGAGLRRRAGRAALVVGGSLLVASWVLVPLIADTKWTTRSEYYQGSFFNDSYGARKVLGWLLTGRLFDDGRFPVITLLLFAGLVVCASRVRDDMRARGLLGAFALSMLLFFGRPTLGPLLDLLPGMGDVQIHRFVMGVHLAGILIAGVGLAWLVQLVVDLARRYVRAEQAVMAGAAAGVALAVVVLAPAWSERGPYDRDGDLLITGQRAADAGEGRELDELVEIAKSRGGGRIYAGLRANWGQEYRVGSVPVYAWLANRDADAIGFTFRTIASLSNDVEAAFDEASPAQYEMFDVRYLLLPADRQPPVPARLIASRGRHRLYEVETSGYFQVVDRAPAVEADRTNLQIATRAFRDSDLASRGVYPGIAFAGGDAPEPTFSGDEPPPGSAGRVVAQRAELESGVFTATVEAARPAVALLKATYDPRWTATVDGAEVEPTMMAPSLVGVDVPAGRHDVRFRYEPYGQYPLLIAVGVLTLLGLALYPRQARRSGAMSLWARNRRFGIGALVAGALVVVLVIWFAVLVGTDASSSQAPTTTATAGTADELRRLVARDHWVFWVGPRKGYSYELSRMSDGSAEVRYLPPAGQAGEGLSVATFPFLNPHSSLQIISSRSGNRRLAVPGSGVGVHATSDSRNVYVAYPGVDFQVRVFHPTPGSAARLATSGKVTPVNVSR
ncbi:MAG TPA: DUF6541 family protein [Gaiellaceae bacterium]|nr:DUF6541 family protein [Gaiellaceae bacterium]